MRCDDHNAASSPCVANMFTVIFAITTYEPGKHRPTLPQVPQQIRRRWHIHHGRTAIAVAKAKATDGAATSTALLVVLFYVQLAATVTPCKSFTMLASLLIHFTLFSCLTFFKFASFVWSGHGLHLQGGERPAHVRHLREAVRGPCQVPQCYRC